MIKEEDMIKTNVDFLVTETTLDKEIPLESVVKVLRARKTTGQLVFHLSQGGVQKVALVEKTKAGAKSDAIREILGM